MNIQKFASRHTYKIRRYLFEHDLQTVGMANSNTTSYQEFFVKNEIHYVM